VRMIACLLPVALLWNCSNPISSIQHASNDSYQTLGLTTYPALKFSSGHHRIELEHGGGIQLVFGNPDVNKTLKVEIQGEEPLALEPGVWRTKILENAGKSLEIRTDGELFVGPITYLGKRQADYANVLLISIDTLRADYFTPERMPLCYSMFEKGLVFERVYTPAPWTLPAHASMLTSLDPAQHGVRLPEDRLASNIPTIASEYADRGYLTLALTEGNYLHPMYGLNSGFHVYHSEAPKLDAVDPEQVSRLEPNLERLRTILSSRQAKHFPLFVFLHTYEVHCPFLPRQGCDAPAEVGQTSWLLKHEIEGFSEDDLVHLRELYQSEVSYTDAALYGFLKDLDLSSWRVVLTSDHGEEFGEHGGLLHADTLFEEVIRVPLAMVGKDVPNGRVKDSASILDIGPTLLALSAETSPESWQGQSWLDPFDQTLVTSKNSVPRAIFSETFFLGPHISSEDPRILGLSIGDEKLIQKRNYQAFEAWYFDLEKDPSEAVNLLEARKERVGQLYPALEAYADQDPNSEKAGEVSEEQLEVLRSLGYTQ